MTKNLEAARSSAFVIGRKNARIAARRSRSAA
jgi:hypothetical protein